MCILGWLLRSVIGSKFIKHFCLEFYWGCRDCLNSQVAFFVSLDWCGELIEELHLRQLTDGV
tara:strand:+ start:1301 stop:1486 length:186 start_codon:yes stop_codon:yes gene_type:complete